MKQLSTSKSWFKRLAKTSLVLTVALTSNALGQNADFMSGKWGVGFRISANQKTNVANYDVDNLVNQMKEIGANHVVLNLSQAANGDIYLAPHAILEGLGADSINERDLFGELAAAFDEAGIDVIAYMATEGPAKLKHGVSKAHDVTTVNGVQFSQFMENWRVYVLNRYGDTSTATYQRAYVEVVVEEFAKRYGELVDGWWFDHANFGNKALIRKTIHKYNPDAAIALNDGQKVPLINNHPGLEDFTAGHVNPVARTVPSSIDNLPMVTSIEGSGNGRFDQDGEASLGHIFMPLAERWNTGDIVWDQAQAEDWVSRTVGSLGSWTWNVATNDAGSEINSDCMTFLRTFAQNVPNFNPDPSKVYYIDSPHHNLRIGATGNSEDPFTTSTSTTGSQVEWKFVAKGNGSWHIQLTAGGSTPRLRSRNNGETDMQATSSSGAWTYYNITPGFSNDTFYVTLPDHNINHNRLQVDSNGTVKFVPGTSKGTWESLRFTEVDDRLVHITKSNATNFAIDSGGTPENGKAVYLWTSNTNNGNQQWEEIDRGGGYYSYQKANTGFSLDGGNGGQNRQDVYLWSSSSTNYNQQWQKVSVGNGAYKLIKRNAAYAINGGSGGAKGQNVNLYDSSNTSQNIQWFVTPLD